MSETPNADRIQQHRAKATELREKAVKMNASDARQQLLDIAREYGIGGCDRAQAVQDLIASGAVPAWLRSIA
jgi:hypothetical protein